MKLMKAYLLSFTIAVGIVLLPIPSFARSGDILIAAGEQTQGDVVRMGRTVTIQAPVEGDIVVAGATVRIEGPVRGNVVAMGAELHITSDVQGSVIAAGGTVEITGSVGGSVIAAGGRVIISDTAQVGRSAIVASSELVFRGRATRDVRFYGDQINFGGEAQGNLYVIARGSDRLVLERTAVVQGDFNYTSYSPADTQQGSLVKGITKHEQLKEPSPRARIGARALGRLIYMFGLMVVGLVFISLVPKAIDEMTERDHLWRWRGAGEGVVWLVITPLAAGALLFTFIGVPLALILAVAWGAAVYVAQVVTVIALGKFVLVSLLKAANPSRFAQLALGALAWAVVTDIPLIGGILCALGVILGLGSMVAFKRQELARYR